MLIERQYADLVLDRNCALVYPFETFSSIEKFLVGCEPRKGAVSEHLLPILPFRRSVDTQGRRYQ